MPPAALHSCRYPGDEDVQLKLPWGALAAPSPALLLLESFFLVCI